MNRRDLLRKSMFGVLGGYSITALADNNDKLETPVITSSNSLKDMRVSLTEQNKGSGKNLSLRSIPEIDNQIDTGIPLIDWILGNTRSIFLYLSSEKVTSLINGLTVDVTQELNLAMADNIAIFLPSGNYAISSSIKVGVNSSLLGNGAKTVYIDNQSEDHAFIFPSGYTRGVKDFSGFSIGSKKNTAVNKYAFYFNDAGDGKLDYSAGWRFLCIELYGYGMGGGWYLQDCFRVTIRDCGASGLSNPFYIRGSVVQLTVDNFVNNGDKQPETPIGSYGVYMATKSYADGNNIKMPEGVTFINCKFVRQAIGAYALGLYVQFVNTEFDYSWHCGGYYAGGDKVDFINCYVGVQTSRKNDFFGFIIKANAEKTPEPVLISNSTVNMTRNVLSGHKSYGVMLLGKNAILCAAKVENCFFRGDGYDSCIYAERVNGVVIRGNTFRVTGLNVKILSAKNITVCDNYGMGRYSLPKPSLEVCWIVTGNIGEFEPVDLSENKNSLIVNQSLFR